mmetsp:Transcript_12519/g.34416  ORF Transcript_12519/g.34416 Transcript_12519/m.34416 type:complete len:101 (-) Transcript_12519:85-387(-)
MQKWIQSVLMLQILLAKCQICPQNDISLMPCSSDHMSLSSQLISVSSGTCVSGNCRCNDDFDGALILNAKVDSIRPDVANSSRQVPDMPSKRHFTDAMQL